MEFSDLPPRAVELIEKLRLQAHPEGGFYRNTYRSPIQFNPQPDGRFEALRHTASSIYYLLANRQYSAFHKLKYDELWFYHEGEPLHICILQSAHTVQEIILGPNLQEGHQLQALVPAGFYFAAYLHRQTSYSLCSCVVTPGFDFQDFDMPAKEHLLHLFPHHADWIERFSK